MLKYEPSSYDSIELNNSARLFRNCCLSVCAGFSVNDTNRELMNELFLYIIGESEMLDRNKGLWLYGPVGTGKSTILKIIQTYDRHSNGKDRTGFYPLGGFPIESASFVANQYCRKGIDGILKYDGANGMALGLDEAGREPKVKYYGTEMDVIQYILQMRYDNRRNCTTLVTTNLLPEDIHLVYGEYIADRVNEMFNVIEVGGKSRR